MKAFKSMARRACLVVLAAALTTIINPWPASAAGNWPDRPSDDPFYTQPDPMPDVAPGTILASRLVTIRAVAIPLPYRAWQVKYRSTDTHGTAIADVATIIQSLVQPPPGKRTLVSYQTAQDGLTTDCAPSYVLRTGLALPAEEEQMMVPLLNAGHTVVTADYEGPDSQYTAARISGQGVLDGIRAAQNFGPAGLTGPATPTALWGYSGGALASAWAAELQPSYAPELRFTGVAAGGVPADLTSVFAKVDGGPYSGIAFGSIAGLVRAYRQINTHALFNTRGKEMLRKIGTMCVQQFSVAYAFQRLSDHTTVPDLTAVPAVKEVLAENSMGRHRPGAPLYIYQAISDDITVTPPVDALVKSYCARGVPVQYQRNPVGDHITEALAGIPGALRYLSDRLAGKAPPSNC